MTASNRLMWINADRVFYAGLLGSPTLRTLGALSLYVALDAPIRISVAGGVWEEGDVAVVPPYRAHVVASDSRVIANLLIEPETVAVATLPGFMKECAGVVDAPELVQRVGDVHRRFTIGAPKWDRDTSEFDRRFFGGKLAPQPLDRRILAVLDEIKSVPLAPISATQCAASIHLSYSRFLHLFKQKSIAFRYRLPLTTLKCL